MSERGNYNAVPPPSNLTSGSDSQKTPSAGKSHIDFESAVAKAKALAARLKDQHAGNKIKDSDDQGNRKRGLNDLGSQNGYNNAANGSTNDPNSSYRGYERDPKRPYPNNDDDDNIDIIAKLTGSSSIYGNNPHFGANTVSEEFNVPSNMVGLIIGRNGETLKRIQGLHGVKITFATENTAGDTERRTTAVGSKESIRQAREMIEQLCQSGTLPRSFMPGMGSGQDDNMSMVGVPRLVSPGILRVQIPISGTKVGLVIGRGGETIRDLCTQSGARINVVQDNSIPHGADVERLINIQGTEDSIERAKALVQAIVNGEFSTNRNSANYGLPISSNTLTTTYGPPPLGQERIAIPIPNDKIAILSSSDTLKSLQQQSRTRITLEASEENPPPATRILHITGFREAIDYCRTLLIEKFDSMGIPVDSNAYGSSGYGGYGMNMPGAMGYGYPMGYSANPYGSYAYPGYQQGYPTAYNSYPTASYPTADGQQQMDYSAQPVQQESGYGNIDNNYGNNDATVEPQAVVPEAYAANPNSVEEAIQTAAQSAASAAMVQHAASFQNNPDGYNAYYKQLIDYYTDHYTNYYKNPDSNSTAANPSTEQPQDQTTSQYQTYEAQANHTTSTEIDQDKSGSIQPSTYQQDDSALEKEGLVSSYNTVVDKDATQYSEKNVPVAQTADLLDETVADTSLPEPTTNDKDIKCESNTNPTSEPDDQDKIDAKEETPTLDQQADP